MVDVDNIDKPLTPVNDTIPTNSTNVNLDDEYWQFNSTFADHDLDNVFEIVPHGELNSELGGKQLLYGERYFPDFVLRLGKEMNDWSYNDAKYDGYMYYQEMAWEVPRKPGAIRGLLQEVPDEGYSGWYCEFMGQEAKPRYQCGNAMVGIGENMQFGAPDLRMK